MKPENKKFDKNLLRRIMSFARPFRKQLIISIVLGIVLAIFAPVRPYLIQYSVDKYIEPKLLQGLINITIIQIAFLLIENFLRFVFMYTTDWLGQSVINVIRKKVYKKVINQNLSYFDKTPIGTLTTRTVNDIESVNDIFSQGFISILADILTIIAIMGVMFYTDWKLTLISLTPFPLLIIATYYFKESVNKSFKRVRNAVAQLNAFVQEHITGMYIVQSFAAEDREMSKFMGINKEHKDANIKAIFAYSIFFPIVEIILAMSMGLLVWWGASRMLNYEVTQGVIIAFIMYMNLLFRPLRMLADKFNTLQMGMVSADRVFSVLDSEEYMQNDGAYIAESIKGKVVFDNVHFEYKEGTPVLKGISFEAKSGQTLALVGQTGAGKSSIISILNRLYEIKSGDILIDDINLNQYNIKELRKKIGIVLQDVFLFSGTIFENISLNDPSISQKKVEEVCKLLDMHNYILSLPGGYQFNVRERGNTLSQGQKQLISFARTLIYDPAILVLDEATSSIDSESEILIQKAIDKMIAGRTAIVIAHRLSTIRKADQIIVLDKGTLAEQGTHDELLALKGLYEKMYYANFKKQEKEPLR